MTLPIGLLLLAQAATLGDPMVVLDSGRYGLKYFPDGCLSVISHGPEWRVLLAAGVSSFLLEGPSMRDLRTARKVLAPGAPGSFDNGYAGIYGTWRAPGGELLAVYHAEDQEGMPSLPNGARGFYATVALAVSRDDGATFEKAGPIIAGRFPKDPAGRADQGCGEPSLVAGRDGRYLYCYYTDHTYAERRSAQICLARSPANAGGRSGSWTKFYHGGFTEPGLGGKDTAVVSAEAGGGSAIFPQVSYSKALGRFVMVLNCHYWKETEPRQSGIYISYSEDGIQWSPPEQILRAQSIARLDREVAWHPTLLLDGDNSRSGWLYYAYSPRWGHSGARKPHYLVARPITLRDPR